MHLAQSFLFFLLQPWFAFMGVGTHVDAETRIPSHLAVGESATATWVIHKGDARGFARLHLRVPEHLNVTPLETAGASFEYKNDVVKLIWLDAPEGEVFQIRLNIEAEPLFAGGSFEPLWSFISDGQRQDVALPSSFVGTSTAGLAGNPLLPAPAEWAVEGEAAAPQSPDLATYDPEQFKALRTFYVEGPDVARVEIEIAGHPKNRFLRVMDALPSGCRAERDVLQGATVSFESQEITFQWYNAPRNNTFRVSYRVMGDLASCLPAIRGTAEFAVGETTQTSAFPPFSWDDVIDPDGWLVATPEPAIQAAVEVPAPDLGISFRVQVLAAHTYVDGKWFQKNFNFASTIDVEPCEDWIKYTTGSFEAYEAARNRREELARGYDFPGPFVTAYEQGERITVQEALVRAQQQWIP